MDMFISEKITTIDGEEMVGSFMYARNGKAHDIAFIKGPDKNSITLPSMLIIGTMC